MLDRSSETLAVLQGHLDAVHLRELFSQDPKRFKQFSVELDSLLFDFSKQRITLPVLQALCALAEARGLAKQREALFAGEKINRSEKRPALHTALRDFSSDPIRVDGQDIKPQIQAVLKNMEDFREKLLSGEIVSANGKKFRDILCLGVGGSGLGPILVSEALKVYDRKEFKLHFISNVDGQHLESCLNTLDPSTTLCLVSSKTFTTAETLTNAKAVMRWFQQAFGADTSLFQQHWVAITAAKQRALSFGITPQQIFEFWDWVGGRYSIWSAVGLPIVLALGMSQFKAFLKGAFTIDQHFRVAPFEKNIPVLMGLLNFWNTQYLKYATQAIIPYQDGLEKLPHYLQQLEMESNGKSVGLDLEPLEIKTAPVIWGGVGCDGQHAFMQLLHQGTEIVPVDFWVGKESHSTLAEHQHLLVASCLSQSRALMEGTQNLEGSQDPLDRMKYCPGNRPSSTFVYPKLTPEILGSLLALYEHKVFVHSVLLGINPFDQWGVELGKKIANTLLPALQNNLPLHDMDSSTQGLVAFINLKN